MSSFYHRRTRRRVHAAKLNAISEHNEFGWEPHKIVENDSINFEITSNLDNIQRVDANEITIEEFRKHFETTGIPVILTGLINKWQANSKWTIPRLYKKYRNQKFKCGEDDDGYSVKLKMKYYIDYMLGTTDDSPL